MNVSNVKNIYFSSQVAVNNQENKKVSTTDVAVATGVAGGGVKAFSNVSKNLSKVNGTINTAAKNVKTTVDIIQTTKKARGTFGNFFNKYNHYRESLIKFGQRVTNSKILKPILTSKAYKGFAGAVGGFAACFVTISGVGELTNSIARKVEQYS